VRILLFASALLLFFTPSLNGQGVKPPPPASRLDTIIARGVLRVGMPGDYLPFGLFNTATGQWQGLDVDIVKAIAEALNVKLEIVKTSWPALTGDLLEDKFDIGAGGISVSLERIKVAFFSTAVLQDGKTPITRCENLSKFGTLADIDKAGVRVITPRGGTNEAFDRAHLHHATIAVFEDNTRIFDELIAGRADLMITDVAETRFQQKLHPELCSAHPEQPFVSSEKAYLLPRDVPLQQWVNEFLHMQQTAGKLDAVIHRWLG
jgi:cyclohexadienyl dehydratase